MRALQIGDVNVYSALVLTHCNQFLFLFLFFASSRCAICNYLGLLEIWFIRFGLKTKLPDTHTNAVKWYSSEYIDTRILRKKHSNTGARLWKKSSEKIIYWIEEARNAKLFLRLMWRNHKVPPPSIIHTVNLANINFPSIIPIKDFEKFENEPIFSPWSFLIWAHRDGFATILTQRKQVFR